jgi:hypothetical protein
MGAWLVATNVVISLDIMSFHSWRDTLRGRTLFHSDLLHQVSATARSQSQRASILLLLLLLLRHISLRKSSVGLTVLLARYIAVLEHLQARD